VGSSVWRFVATFVKDEHGQDLVEYALLGAFVAIATMLGLKAITDAMGPRYVIWDNSEQNLWEPPSP
jgi:Flp pilus assembly pilin Flp